jgi:hypothetical protein
MYWLDGTWMFDRESLAEWRTAFAQLSGIGGSIVLQFGHALVGVTPTELAQRCNRPGIPSGFLPAGGRLDGRAVARLAFYGGEELFEDFPTDRHALARIADIAAGPGGDPQRVWRLVSDDESGSVNVTYGFGRLSKRSQREDWMLEAATDAGMQLLLGMPMLPALPEPDSWRVDDGLLPSWRLVTRWWLSNCRQRWDRHPAVLGFYQSFEADLDPKSPTWDGYRAVRDLIDNVYHPSARLAISPYAICRNRPEGPGHTAESIEKAVEVCARSGVDIIIPQDGRGAGLNALFWEYERAASIGDVDPALANYQAVAPGDTFSERFSLSTGEMYPAVRRAVDRLIANGYRMTLWANVEAFEIDVEDPSHASDPSLSPIATTNRATTRDRLDRAAMFAAGHCSRIVSFMWDPFFVSPRGAMGVFPSMLAEIGASPDRPLICGAFLFDSAGTPGLVARGYNLARTQVSVALTWYDRSRGLQSRTHIVGSAGWVDADFGQRDARRPPRLQELFIPFDRTSIAASSWVHLRPESSDGGAGPIYSMRYT